jgi:tetratricopeptide (TPR) repeat protein/DNA-binding XRE family transcriptional regulator
MDRRTPTAVAPAPPLATPDRGLGERVRRLRTARGLTQTELAEARVSKEYISQIETGKTRPTPQTLDWLAERLGVDTHYLVEGVSDREHREHEEIVCRAEDAVHEKRYADAVELLSGLSRAPASPELHLRALFAESWARMYLGELRTALDRLERARQVAAGDTFGDVDRAEVLYRIACCRYKLNHVAQSLADFSAALELADRSGESCDRLRAHVLEWRSRCYRRQRDWEAAREDIDRALELAEGLGDDETIAHVHFQASLVAERNGSWAQARRYSERAKKLYEAVDDPVNVGRLLNNLGCLSFLLGHKEQAVEQLKDAFRIALEIGDPADAAQAVSSLADVHLRSGELDLAERHARHALEMLDGRVDFLGEIGMAQIVLGRALMGQDRLDEAEQAFADAETSFSQLSSVSHNALVWTARGDLALARGDDRGAGELFRRAAEALQENVF